MREDMQTKFVDLWSLPKMYFFAEEVLSVSLLSSFHADILNSSRNSVEAWSRLEFFLIRLVKAELCPPVAFEQQCLAMFRREDWSTYDLKRMASCIDGVLTSLKKSSPQNFSVELLDWLINFVKQKQGEFEEDFPALY